MKLDLVPIRSGRVEDFCSARVAAQTKGVSVQAVYDALETGRLTGYLLHEQTVLKVTDVQKWEPRRNARRTSKQGENEMTALLEKRTGLDIVEAALETFRTEHPGKEPTKIIVSATLHANELMYSKAPMAGLEGLNGEVPVTYARISLDYQGIPYEFAPPDKGENYIEVV